MASSAIFIWLCKYFFTTKPLTQLPIHSICGNICHTFAHKLLTQTLQRHKAHTEHILTHSNSAYIHIHFWATLHVLKLLACCNNLMRLSHSIHPNNSSRMTFFELNLGTTEWNFLYLLQFTEFLVFKDRLSG